MSTNCFSIQRNLCNFFFYLLIFSHIFLLFRRTPKKKIVYCFSKNCYRFSHIDTVCSFFYAFAQNIMFISCFSLRFFLFQFSQFRLPLRFFFVARCYFSRKFHWVEPLVRGKKKKIGCESSSCVSFSFLGHEFSTTESVFTLKSSIFLFFLWLKVHRFFFYLFSLFLHALVRVLVEFDRGTG